MTDNYANTQYWDKHRGVIRSRKGGWKIGQGVFSHGYDLMEDLMGKVSYFQLLVLHATGRLPERRVADWIETTYFCLNWPDSRIWCNQVGALGGTMRTSVVSATAAGILAGDSRAYGQGTQVEAVSFIQSALSEKKRGLTPREIVQNECKRHGGKPHIMGFARPIAKGDERVGALEKLTQRLEFIPGEHLQLAYEIEKVLAEDFDEYMNVSGYASAFLADQGFTPQETYQFCATLVACGVMACYVDAFERPPETFLPMRCDDIDYQGPPPRPVP
jgi:hypothetical protein